MNPQKTEMMNTGEFYEQVRKDIYEETYQVSPPYFPAIGRAMEEYAQSKLAAATVDDGRVVWKEVSVEDELPPEGHVIAKSEKTGFTEYRYKNGKWFVPLGTQWFEITTKMDCWLKKVTISQSEDGGMREALQKIIAMRKQATSTEELFPVLQAIHEAEKLFEGGQKD